MPRCCDCRFWKPWPDSDAYGTCTYAPKGVATGGKRPPPPGGERMFTLQAANISTSHDFGCVQFEGKE